MWTSFTIAMVRTYKHLCQPLILIKIRYDYNVVRDLQYVTIPLNCDTFGLNVLDGIAWFHRDMESPLHRSKLE